MNNEKTVSKRANPQINLQLGKEDNVAKPQSSDKVKSQELGNESASAQSLSRIGDLSGPYSRHERFKAGSPSVLDRRERRSLQDPRHPSLPEAPAATRTEPAHLSERTESQNTSLPVAPNATVKEPSHFSKPANPQVRTQPRSIPRRPAAEDKTLEHMYHGNYKPEQHVKRSQNVLGLKYVFEKHGIPRRQPQRSAEPPQFIDQVFSWHDNKSRSVRGPPPGLDVGLGQADFTNTIPRSSLVQYWHYRARRSQQEDPRPDDVKGKDHAT